ncbi:MAG: DnaK suppressor protein [Bacteroidia bacterium]|jgi:DnaK suppressor protein
MNNKDLRHKLCAMRKDLNQTEASSLEAAGTVVLDQSSVGRLSRMDALQAQAMSIETGRRRQKLLKAIARSLDAIDDGSYGFCLECDQPIADERLLADPVASLCIQCASQLEL